MSSRNAGPVKAGRVCTACGRTFSGVTAFDRHQLGVGSAWEDNPVRCLDPEERGLVLTMRSYGEVWAQPGRDVGA